MPALPLARLEVVELSGRGTVYSYAVLHHPQHPAFDYPVIAALVDLDEGIRLVSNLVDIDPRDIAHRHAGRGRVRADARRHGRAGLPAAAAHDAGSLDAAIVGIGQTEFSSTPAAANCSWPARRSSPPSPMPDCNPATSTASSATPIDPVEETELVRSVGFPGDRLLQPGPLRRRRLDGRAAARGERRGSGRGRRGRRLPGDPSPVRATRFGAAKTAPSPTSAHSGTTAMQWCMPYGVLTPASWMALNATRYMHTYGVTSEDFGRAVVQLRAYAATNPAAWGYKRPITLEDHQASRWIAEPSIRLFDCCQETDGSVALVITSADRAADAAAPPVAHRRRRRRRASSSRRSPPTTTGPISRSWTDRSPSPSGCSTAPGFAATTSTSP